MGPEGEGDRVIRRGDTFTWRGETLTVAAFAYNQTLRNERAVELPIAWRWLKDVPAGSGVLEVGNVLSHYPTRVPERDIVDLWEPGPGVQNVDLFDVTGRYDVVVSISTAEHVRWDQPPRDLDGSLDAIAHLRSLLNPGGRMLLTVPLNHQPKLDIAILEGTTGATRDSTMMLDGSASKWSEHEGGHFGFYGRLTRWASAVWVAEWIAPEG
jgi:SAM-dependent methyltransferase